MEQTAHRLTMNDLKPDEKEFLRLFHSADQEMQEFFLRMIPLTSLHGDLFLNELEGPMIAKDRNAIRAVLEKWEATGAETS